MFVRTKLILLGAWLSLGLFGGSALAETFLLSNGGSLEGRLLNAEQIPRQSYVVELTTGGKITLTKSQVAKVVGKTPAEVEYDALLARMPADAESHWKLSEWCRKKDGLDSQREFHLTEAVRLSPEHELARRALGYSKLDGKWVKPEDHMERMGYVRFGGAWRTRQEVDIETQRDEREKHQKELAQDIRRWRASFTGKRAAEGLAAIKALRDPAAAVALGEMLPNEQDFNVRLLYVEVLGNLQGQAGAGPLILAALKDENDQVRDNAASILANWRSSLATTNFVKALKSKDNNLVLRAGAALARMQDPSSILPLIDALVTHHKWIIKTGNAGSIGANFGNNGSGGLSAGGSGQKLIEKDLENGTVLDALVAMSNGANFRFDKKAWRQWYTDQQAPAEAGNLRRDE